MKRAWSWPAAKCGRCGGDAKGYATINQVRYCHDDSAKPSCYEQQSHDDARSGRSIISGTWTYGV